MTERSQVYKCEICGNIVEVLHAGAGQLVCCGQPMQLTAENTVDASAEKHVPVVERTDAGYRVRIGSVPHPMADAHHIEWVELTAGDTVLRRYLEPGQAPEATFVTDLDAVSARSYCNLHGLWRA